MATSKTLTPTNETISIPALGDAPDASVFSNCIEKEADAINTLNSKLGYQLKQVHYGNETSVTFSISDNTRYMFIVAGSNTNDALKLIIYSTSAGSVGAAQVYKGNNVTIDVSTTSKLKLTFTQSVNRFFIYAPLSSASGAITKD